MVLIRLMIRFWNVYFTLGIQNRVRMMDNVIKHTQTGTISKVLFIFLFITKPPLVMEYLNMGVDKVVCLSSYQYFTIKKKVISQTSEITKSI